MTRTRSPRSRKKPPSRGLRPWLGWALKLSLVGLVVLAAIDAASAAGGDVTLDAYPYLSSATYLSSMLPGWAQTEGAEATLAMLREPESRERILHELEVVGSDGQHGVPVDWRPVREPGRWPRLPWLHATLRWGCARPWPARLARPGMRWG